MNRILHSEETFERLKGYIVTIQAHVSLTVGWSLDRKAKKRLDLGGSGRSDLMALAYRISWNSDFKLNLPPTTSDSAKDLRLDMIPRWFN